MKYLVFDFDGVLGNTIDCALEAHVKSGYFETLEEAKVDMQAYINSKPKHIRNHTLTEEEMLAEHAWVKALGANMHAIGFTLFESFIDEIKKLEDVKIAIVSTGSEVYVKPAVLKTGLSPTHVLTFEDHHSKEEKIERVAKDWGVEVKEVYYFTDTLADVYELKDLISSGKLIGVSWGFCRAEALESELGKDRVLQKPEDIHTILKYA